MDWKTAFVTFALVFFAELGDKTQLTTMMLTAQYKAPWAVFVGAALALAITSLLGVTFGEWVSQVVSPTAIRNVAGIAFMVLGVLLVAGRL
ncbi:MAG: TMEM165/GDT1 family protein [Firmicutes bacterium]|nr:TMEM165/GDT1 family protein [Bacillota bacterium]